MADLRRAQQDRVVVGRDRSHRLALEQLEVEGLQILAQVRRSGLVEDQSRPVISLSIGVAAVALPAKNFAPQTLLESARRCHDASHHGGGNGMKSIEIF